MKTPEEIKKGLECCLPCEDPDCLECQYTGVASCADTRMDDTLAYIQQLEEKVALYDECVADAAASLLPILQAFDG